MCSKAWLHAAEGSGVAGFMRTQVTQRHPFPACRWSAEGQMHWSGLKQLQWFGAGLMAIYCWHRPSAWQWQACTPALPLTWGFYKYFHGILTSTMRSAPTLSPNSSFAASTPPVERHLPCGMPLKPCAAQTACSLLPADVIHTHQRWRSTASVCKSGRNCLCHGSMATCSFSLRWWLKTR